jgi:rRNA maturation endonuclease Nob1
MYRTGEGFGELETKYRCIACGSFVRGSACSNCGSKMKEAEF